MLGFFKKLKTAHLFLEISAHMSMVLCVLLFVKFKKRICIGAMLTSRCSFKLIPPTGALSRQMTRIDGVLSVSFVALSALGKRERVS